MTEQTIPNALTPEEWADPLREVEGAVDVELLSPATRHRNAAICLEGHPYGFTRDDVELLQGAIVVIERSTDPSRPAAFYSPRLEHLRARLAALLPGMEAHFTRELNRRL